MKRSQETLTLAQVLGRPYSLVSALNFAAIVYRACGKRQIAQELEEESRRISSEQGFREAMTRGAITQGWSLVEQGRGEEGIATINGKEISLMSALISATCPFNLTGQPALTVPCGFTASGLPLALQIVGRPFDEVTVLQVGHAYEAQTEWRQRRPMFSF